MTIDELIAGALAGRQREIGRLLTAVETSLEGAADVQARLGDAGRTGNAVGFFGPPGVGKSSLLAALVPQLREGGGRVAVVANDPTSAFGGGALLGDRLRMLASARDPGVFIRSAAARDPRRSLSATMVAAVDLLTRIGFSWVLVEAVGTGQADLGTRLVADSNVLVLAPGLGDYVQGMKAGVMEVADIIVVNKCALADSRPTLAVLREAAKSLRRPDGHVPPVVAVAAADGSGVSDLIDAVRAHLDARGSVGPRREIVADAVTDLTVQAMERSIRARLPSSAAFERQIDAICDGRQGVVRAAIELAAAALTND